MKLNKKSLINFREILSKELMLVNDCERIELERDLIEDLIFEKVYDEKNKRYYKKIVWSGLFLQYLDLSGISFDNVDWSDKNEKYLANTNAIIDFGRGYYSSEEKYQGLKIIRNCRFDGTDLSSSNIDMVDGINNCSLKRTKIDLRDFFQKRKKVNNVELNGLNLKGVNIDLVDYPDVCFTDTGASLSLNPNDNRLQYNHSKSHYGLNYSKDFYAGCTINGKKVFYREQNKNMASIRFNGYQAYERSVINSTLGLIKKHKKGL